MFHNVVSVTGDPVAFKTSVVKQALEERLVFIGTLNLRSVF